MQEQPEALKSRRHISLSKQKVFTFVVFLLLVGALGGFVWSFTSYQDLKGQLAKVSSLEGQQEIDRIEIAQLLASVSQHIILPRDEEPTVATIQDIDALVEQQEVFRGAENGDKVIVYSDIAIIYSPTKDILIKVVPVFIENSDSEQAEATEQDAPQAVRVDIRNGSQIPGAAQSLSDRLDSDPAYEVTSVTNAAHFNYEETVLVNAAGRDIAALEQELGVSAIFTFPEGEQLTGADVVIIIGNQ